MSAQQNTTIYFQERQQFRQLWLWLLLIFVSAFSSGTLLWIVSGSADLGAEAAKSSVLNGLGMFCIGMNVFILWLFFYMRLSVEVSQMGLFVQFRPLHRKVHKLDLREVTLVESVEYSALMEYGGYGIRKRRMATAYNVAGKLGVRIHFENGYHFLIGSQRPDELAEAITTYLEQDAGSA